MIENGYDLGKLSENEEVVNWYSHYLQNRITITEVKGETQLKHVRLGCPQDGELSVILWNIAFGELINRYNVGPLKIVRRLSDDRNLIITGESLEEMYKHNNSIKKAEDWVKEFG